MGNGVSVGVVLRCVGCGFVGRGRLGLLYTPLKKGLDFCRNVLTGGGILVAQYYQLSGCTVHPSALE